MEEVHIGTWLRDEEAHLLRDALNGGRFPDRDATLGQALGRYLEVADLEVSTKEAHQGYIRRTICPVLGTVRIRKPGPDRQNPARLVHGRNCGCETQAASTEHRE